jgi:hypothetical protein
MSTPVRSVKHTRREADSNQMSMTILPGAETDERVPEPAPRRMPPQRPTALLAVLAVAVASGLGFGAWKLLGSHGSPAPTAAVTPVTHPTHAAPQGLPAHGRVTAARLRAVATPGFLAMSQTFGSLAAKGRVHVRRDGFENGQHLPGCAKSLRSLPRPLDATSPKYRQITPPSAGSSLPWTLQVEGEVAVFAGSAQATHAFRAVTTPAMLSCLRSDFARQLHGTAGGRAVVGGSVTAGFMHLRSARHVLRIRMVAGFVVNGTEFAVKVDGLLERVGRSVVSTTFVNGVQALNVTREVDALRVLERKVA